MRKLSALFSLFALLSGLALAQDTTLPSLDPSKLGGDVLALSGVVLLVVQFIKRQVERPPSESPEGGPPVEGRKQPAWVWWGLSLLLAEAGAAGLFYANFGATFGELPAPWGWLAYGLLSGIAASGFKDLVIGLIKAKPAAPVVIVTPPEGGLEPIK